MTLGTPLGIDLCSIVEVYAEQTCEGREPRQYIGKLFPESLYVLRFASDFLCQLPDLFRKPHESRSYPPLSVSVKIDLLDLFLKFLNGHYSLSRVRPHSYEF